MAVVMLNSSIEIFEVQADKEGFTSLGTTTIELIHRVSSVTGCIISCLVS